MKCSVCNHYESQRKSDTCFLCTQYFKKHKHTIENEILREAEVLKKRIYKEFDVVTGRISGAPLRIPLRDIIRALNVSRYDILIMCEELNKKYTTINFKVVNSLMYYLIISKTYVKPPAKKKLCPTCGKLDIMTTKTLCHTCYNKFYAQTVVKQIASEDRCMLFDQKIKDLLPNTARSIAQKLGENSISIGVKLAHIYLKKERKIERTKDAKHRWVYFVPSGKKHGICNHCKEVKPLRKIGVCTPCYKKLYKGVTL